MGAKRRLSLACVQQALSWLLYLPQFCKLPGSMKLFFKSQLGMSVQLNYQIPLVTLLLTYQFRLYYNRGGLRYTPSPLSKKL